MGRYAPSVSVECGLELRLARFFVALLNRFSNSRSFSTVFWGVFSDRLAMESVLALIRDGEERFTGAACLGV